LLGHQGIGALVLTAVAQPLHQQLFVTAPDVHIVADRHVADSQFSVGKGFIRPAEQRSRLAPLVMKVGELRSFQSGGDLRIGGRGQLRELCRIGLLLI
jgi:hypothetical protein